MSGIQSTRRNGAAHDLKRPALWLLLVVSSVCNVVANTADVNVFVGPAFGLVALACAGTLIRHHYKNRRAV
ncbi:hypothetical protein [Nonomuraea sp. NPDC050643]|uniref:hypothetical protein n=1 Tax=Nonomuraea sp. NPDC050643 TaxID=3155660 RepID=UPI0034077A51